MVYLTLRALPGWGGSLDLLWAQVPDQPRGKGTEAWGLTLTVKGSPDRCQVFGFRIRVTKGSDAMGWPDGDHIHRKLLLDLQFQEAVDKKVYYDIICIFNVNHGSQVDPLRVITARQAECWPLGTFVE